MSLVPFDETSLSQGIGGAQTWCISLAEQLACMSHDVVVLAQCCCKHFSNNVLWIPLSKVLQNGGHFFISYLDKMNFDVILVSRPTQSLLEMVNSIHSNVYVVYHGPKEGVTTYCEALKSRNIRKIVALTSWHRKYMISEMGISENKIEVIPNGIRMEDFMYLDAEHDVDHTILWSSEPLRGLNVLTQSLLPNLKKYISDIKVDVALPLYVKADFIDNDINYLGHLSKHDLYSNMNRHAVWFYPSIYRETFCITAIETVMCGNMPVIPVRIDSLIRIENLLAVIKLINNNFNTNIYVIEADSYNNHITDRLLPRNVIYRFIRDADPIFHRTHYINLMCKEIETDIVAVWDADIIIPQRQVIDAVNVLRNNIADFAFPYNGHFLDTGEILRDYYMHNPNIGFLERHIGIMNITYGERCAGGAYMVRLDKYKEIGLENEAFYGWGYEDFERATRMSNYGLKGYRSKLGPLFHLSHPRNINGVHSNVFQKKRSGYIAESAVNRTRENIISIMKTRT